MSRRHDVVFALTLTIWLSVLAAVFLAWCSVRGFDPGLCRAYHQCGWMDA